MKRELDIQERHELSPQRLQFVECWWVIFDVNGNAPADADVVACATEELATRIKSLLDDFKDDNYDLYLVLGKKKYTNFNVYSVEGYEWDSSYAVRQGWAREEEIVRSLADLSISFFGSSEDTTEDDGIYQVHKPQCED